MISLISLMFFIVAIYYFNVANNKKYSIVRQKEAERYFNYSIIEKNNEIYKSRQYIESLSFIKDKNINKYIFIKKGKFFDTGLLF